MDKRVIFAVAGSGKTTLIVERLSLEKRALLLTFTHNTHGHLRSRIQQKFGYMPKNIKVMTYFDFLYSHCYRPFLSSELGGKGLSFKPNVRRFATGDERYIDKYKRLYSNRVARLLVEKKVLGEINNRLEKYYDELYIDEVQDFAGHDFNLLKHLSSAKLSLLFVGDFYQHTFDTSRDGSVNSTLHDDYEKYKANFIKMGLEVDCTTLVKSYRCNPSVCGFIFEKIGILIESHGDQSFFVGVIDDPGKVDELFANPKVVKLFFQEQWKYDCFSRNWGECKGEDHYQDVCVVINDKTWKNFKKSDLKSLSPQTKNKLYVACSRARGNLYFVEGGLYKKFKFLTR